ncbi:MAG: DUF2780 domain-containing protein [Xanthomonadales bacterium]|nr:DUF2780 domain-containing protein [Xanthomonadales bacterium]MDH3923711.1 DUF2780 domain-containing protein [Xanthomonadales bacterium]MDH3939532.1 DUF2780 domain-containing protein [Xanthomonadales bacterium]MDH4000348.1 DUF2780 domain-containing protein [Xanthomonadales bacterium]
MLKERHFSLVRYVTISLLLLSFSLSAQAGSSDLVGMLTDQLGISKEQAAGSSGAIFDYAKQNLSADDFATVAEGVPDMDGLLAAAPAAESDSALGKASSMLGGSGGSLGGLASLASSFESLGLDADMVQKVVPIVTDYIGNVSGDQAMALLQGLF